MRTQFPKLLEDGRVFIGEFSSPPGAPFGAFSVHGPCGEQLKIVATDGSGVGLAWEHVSVSTRRRVPNWKEMCFVKNLFWSEEECVVQYHPPKSEYINTHPYVLHLWRNATIPFPMPPKSFVGFTDEQLENAGIDIERMKREQGIKR